MPKLYMVVSEQKFHIGEMTDDEYERRGYDDIDYDYDIQISNALTNVEYDFELEE